MYGIKINPAIRSAIPNTMAHPTDVNNAANHTMSCQTQEKRKKNNLKSKV